MPGYTLPDGITLKNKLFAASLPELEALEADYVRNRLFALQLSPGPTGNFDTAHLKAIHKHLFQDVYEWAGRTRNGRVKLADGSAASEQVMRKAGGRPFLHGRAINAALDAMALKLLRARPLSKERRDF